MQGRRSLHPNRPGAPSSTPAQESDGAQTWQGLAGLIAPPVYVVPPMSQLSTAEEPDVVSGPCPAAVVVDELVEPLMLTASEPPSSAPVKLAPVCQGSLDGLPNVNANCPDEFTAADSGPQTGSRPTA